MLAAPLLVLALAAPAHAAGGVPTYPGALIPTVVISDQTPPSAGWPVATGALRWNASPYVHTLYTRRPCSQLPSRRCVRVSVAPLPPSWYAAFVSDRVVDGIQVGSIQVNAGADPRRAIRIAVICHEVGHALGLDHMPGSGCMTEGLTGTGYPSGRELDLLAQWYGGPNITGTDNPGAALSI